jgi:hypothetical protein
MLGLEAARREISSAASEAVVLKAFWAACFVIDLSKSSMGAAQGPDTKGFFTKLSTEFVHIRRRLIGRRHRKRGCG